MRVRLLIALLLLLLVQAPIWPAAANTAAGEPVLFPETGHSLAYNFRSFWSVNGGLPIFGYPLTEVFIEEGRPVQYFERARFEWHADKTLVLAGHLGRWAAQQQTGHPAFTPVAGPTSEDIAYFPQTGHTLRGAFKYYWETRGGLSAFGYPISEEFHETSPHNGADLIVQYFERARFEWHPDLPPDHQVQLGHLGRQYLESRQPAPAWALAPVSKAEQAWSGLRPTQLQMPRIGIDTEVVEGGFSLGAWDVPRYTAVHYWPVSGYPGTAGNIVIAGHVGYRDTIFNHLPQAAVGDDIILFMGEAQRRYRVTEIWTVSPNDSWVMGPTTVETLTLITCVPIDVYSHRLIVRATPVQP